ncbi:MAG TPA: thiamine pyrophosphate-dependent enzyme, partial [Candidatus Sulfotelmatobacter sp.]|nr:thiamine pyrophosphate-dependent enzyme [Candidatus Sulfotelmatobacter sp.]
MSSDQVVEAMRLMLLSRAVDERLIKLQRMGRVGVYGPVLGQEAAVIGSAMALDPSRDWMVPASREHPAMLRHGLPLTNMFATYMGNFDLAAIPEG